MTVTNENRSVTYNGDGSTTVFPVANDGVIYFLQPTDLLVTLIDADGTEHVQALTTNYTVAGAGEQTGGSVTMLVAPAVGKKLRIERIVNILQPTNYPENTKFPAKSHERALDRLTMIDQQLQAQVDRAPKFPVGSGLKDIQIDVPGNGKLLGWSADGKSIVPTETTVDERTQRINADKALASLIGQAGPIEVPVYDTTLAVSLANIKPTINSIRTGGYSSPGDGGGALYKRVESEPTHAGKIQSADGAWWELLPNEDGVVSAASFGAFPSLPNAHPPLQAGLDYAIAKSCTLYIPAGSYMMNNYLLAPNAGNPFVVKGAGPTRTVLVRNSDYSGPVMSVHTSDDWIVEEIGLDAKFSIYPANSHGLVFHDCKRARISRVHVKDWNGTAINGYLSAPIGQRNFPSEYRGVVIADCFADGLNAANNGILLDGYAYSYLINCEVVHLNRTGSPAYGLQFKNECYGCGIIGGRVYDARVGLALGGDGTRGHYNKASGVLIEYCVSGIIFGGGCSWNEVSDLIIDMQGEGNHAIDLNAGTRGLAARNIIIRNLAANRFAVLCRDTDVDNDIEVSVIEAPNGVHPNLITFNAGSAQNRVKVAKIAADAPLTASAGFITNSGASTNKVEFGAGPLRQNATIASGAVTLDHAGVGRLRVDTEGGAASDDLDNINGGVDGQRLIVGCSSSARPVTVRSNQGNIRLLGGGTYVLSDADKTLEFTFNGITNRWNEIGRG